MSPVPPSAFALGDLVTVVAGEGRTVRTGEVARIVWPHALQRHMYFLRVGARRADGRGRGATGVTSA